MKCTTGEPTSWLALERRALGELGAAESAGIEAHLGSCAACAACAQAIAEDRVALRALPPASTRRERPWWWWAAAPALAAATVWIALPRVEQPTIKGGEATIQLVGEDGLARRTVAIGEPIKAVVNCAAREALDFELVVYDEDGASFPLPRGGGLRCENGAVLPGAFGLTRSGEAKVCVAIGTYLPPREALARDPGLASACAPLRIHD
jgi:hypothetical protein